MLHGWSDAHAAVRREPHGGAGGRVVFDAMPRLAPSPSDSLDCIARRRRADPAQCLPILLGAASVELNRIAMLCSVATGRYVRLLDAERRRTARERVDGTRIGRNEC